MKNISTYILILFLLTFIGRNSSFAQEVDTTSTEIIYNDAAMGLGSDGGVTIVKEDKEHIPSKAAMYSAILPGLGQIYNKRYWKLPIVYAAIGGGVYGVVWNQKNYKVFLEAYRIRLSGGQDEYFNTLKTEEQLISWMDFYRNQRDLSIIITVGLYAFNILDAYVDAHLINFNINDNLALKVEPTAFPNAIAGSYYSYGLRLSMDLK